MKTKSQSALTHDPEILCFSPGWGRREEEKEDWSRQEEDPVQQEVSLDTDLQLKK